MELISLFYPTFYILLSLLRSNYIIIIPGQHLTFCDDSYGQINIVSKEKYRCKITLSNLCNDKIQLTCKSIVKDNIGVPNVRNLDRPGVGEGEKVWEVGKMRMREKKIEARRILMRRVFELLYSKLTN